MSNWRKFCLLGVAMIVLFVLAGIALALAVLVHSLAYLILCLVLWTGGVSVVLLGERVQKQMEKEAIDKIMRREDDQ